MSAGHAPPAVLPLAVRVADCLGIGRLPAPGTAASLAALLPGAAMLRLSPVALVLGAVGAFAAGLWAVPRAGGDADPGWVVVDEVAGQWLALSGLAAWPADLSLGWGIAAAFALFRLLDIAKPGPVGWADRRHGAAGVMLDDAIAGAIAAGLLLAAPLARRLWT